MQSSTVASQPATRPRDEAQPRAQHVRVTTSESETCPARGHSARTRLCCEVQAAQAAKKKAEKEAEERARVARFTGSAAANDSSEEESSSEEEEEEG